MSIHYTNGTDAMQWCGCTIPGCAASRAQEIVAWVRENGGEARYEPEWEWSGYGSPYSHPARIAVRTINGWAYATPGGYVVAEMKASGDPTSWAYREWYEFSTLNPATFKKCWGQKP